MKKVTRREPAVLSFRVKSIRCISAWLLQVEQGPLDIYYNQAGMKPTRPENVEATMMVPFLTFSPSAGSDRGAGPSTTSAPFLGSKTEPWQEHTNASRSDAKTLPLRKGFAVQN